MMCEGNLKEVGYGMAVRVRKTNFSLNLASTSSFSRILLQRRRQK